MKLDTNLLNTTAEIMMFPSATTAYPYVTTPTLLLHSSTDTTIRYCYEDTEEFWQRWKEELADIGARIAAFQPDNFGVFLVNCPFHGAVWHSYDNMEVNQPELHIFKFLEIILIRSQSTTPTPRVRPSCSGT